MPRRFDEDRRNKYTKIPQNCRNFRTTPSLQRANYMESQAHYIESPH